MIQVGKDVLYFQISAANPVTHTVPLGEWFEVRTQINAGPWIDDLPKAEAAAVRQRICGPNPSSGCIHVKGIRAGDVLSVEIGEFQLDEIGYTRFSGNNGAMPGLMEIGPQQKIVRIRNGLIEWSRRLKLPVQPMLGYVGVSPRGREKHHNGWGGYWGGNMDVQEVTTGTTLHVKTHHDGALLQIGDMHAIQGDGEICGAGGIEAGGIVSIRCTKKAGTGSANAATRQQLVRFENATHIGTIATAVPAENAFRLALRELLHWLAADFALAHGDAYMLLAQVLEARCTQFVNPSFTYVTKVGRTYLPAKAGKH